MAVCVWSASTELVANPKTHLSHICSHTVRDASPNVCGKLGTHNRMCG